MALYFVGLLPFGTGPSHPSSGVRRGNRPPDCCLYRLTPLRLSVQGALSALCYPASLESPGRAIRGTPVRRAKGSPDPLQSSGSPLAHPLSGRKVHRSFLLIRFALPGPLKIKGLRVNVGLLLYFWNTVTNYPWLVFYWLALECSSDPNGR